MDMIALGVAGNALGKAEQALTTLEHLPKGLVYKGAVDYQKDLPKNPEVGDTYTVKYTGTSGSVTDGAEYVWGKYNGTNQWIKIGSDIQVTEAEKSAWNAKYDKPVSGIPNADLASEVQNSLAKADTALQQHQDISGKQDVILDLETIRSGAALGATALQSHQDISGKLDKKPDGTNDLIVNNKVNVTYLPDDVLGRLSYQGTFNSALPTPTSANKGHYYIYNGQDPIELNPDGSAPSAGGIGEITAGSTLSTLKINPITTIEVNGQQISLETYLSDYVTKQTIHAAQYAVLFSDHDNDPHLHITTSNTFDETVIYDFFVIMILNDGNPAAVYTPQEINDGGMYIPAGWSKFTGTGFETFTTTQSIELSTPIAVEASYIKEGLSALNGTVFGVEAQAAATPSVGLEQFIQDENNPQAVSAITLNPNSSYDLDEFLSNFGVPGYGTGGEGSETLLQIPPEGGLVGVFDRVSTGEPVLQHNILMCQLGFHMYYYSPAEQTMYDNQDNELVHFPAAGWYEAGGQDGTELTPVTEPVTIELTEGNYTLEVSSKFAGLNGTVFGIPSQSATPSANTITFNKGDWAVSNSSTWDKVDNSEQVTSVNGETGAVILDADDIDDTNTTNKFVTSSQKSKIDSIFWIDADLSAVGFTPVSGKYYKHTGTTETYINGLIYYYNGSALKVIDGSGEVAENEFNIIHVTGSGTNFEPQNWGSWTVTESDEALIAMIDNNKPVVIVSKVTYPITVGGESGTRTEYFSSLGVINAGYDIITTDGTTTSHNYTNPTIQGGIGNRSSALGYGWNIGIEVDKYIPESGKTYPYVTTSYSTINDLKTGLGINNLVNKGMDSTPTQNSQNYVQSGGVYTALQNNKFWTDVDLSSGTSGLSANNYYKHSGTTTGTYINGLIYFYDGASLKLIEGKAEDEFNIIHITGSTNEQIPASTNSDTLINFIYNIPISVTETKTQLMNMIAENKPIIAYFDYSYKNPVDSSKTDHSRFQGLCQVGSNYVEARMGDGDYYAVSYMFMESPYNPSSDVIYISKDKKDSTSFKQYYLHLQKSDVGLGNVENKVMDSIPTESSTNYITSGGVYAAIAEVQGNIITDLEPLDGSENPVQSGGVYTALTEKLDKKPNGSSDLIDSNNKVNTTYIPDYLLGQVVYGGTVDATTGTATLSTNAKTKLGTSSTSIVLTNDTTAITGYVANEGIYYIVTTSGVFASLGLITGDWLISSGSAWKKIDNTDAVQSVAGKTGAVVLDADDIVDTNTTHKFVSATDKTNWNGKVEYKGTFNGALSAASSSNKGDYYICNSTNKLLLNPDGTLAQPLQTFSLDDAITKFIFNTDLTTAQVKTIIESIDFTEGQYIEGWGTMVALIQNSTGYPRLIAARMSLNPLDQNEYGYAIGVDYTGTFAPWPTYVWSSVAIEGYVTEGFQNLTNGEIAVNLTVSAMAQTSIWNTGELVGKGFNSTAVSYESKDWAVSNGTTWDKIDNNNKVTSVAGKTGAVTLEKSDVGLGNVVNKTMDSAPTSSSENYVQSGGVYAALAGKLNNAPDGTNNLISNNKIQNRYLQNGQVYYVSYESGSAFIYCDGIAIVPGQCLTVVWPYSSNTSPTVGATSLIFKDYSGNSLVTLYKDLRFNSNLSFGQNIIRIDETGSRFTVINTNLFPITTNNLFTATRYTHGRYIFFNTQLSIAAVDAVLSQIPLTISTGMTGSNEIGVLATDVIDTNYGLYVVDCTKFGGTGYLVSINNGFTVYHPVYISQYSVANLTIIRTLLGDNSYTYSQAGWQTSAYDFNASKPNDTEFTPYDFNYKSGLSKLFNLCPDGVEYGETESNVYVPKASPGTELWDMVYGIIDDKKPVLDSSPTQNSTNGITSGGVYTALTQVGNYITKTSSISKNDQTLITSGGIYDGLYGMFGIKPQEELIYGVTYYFNTAIPSSVLDEMIADIDWIIDVDTGEGEVGAVSSLIGDITDNHLELLAVNLENLGGDGYALIWATTADDALVSYEGLVYISSTDSANTALFQAMLDPNFVMPATAGWQMSSYTMATDINPIMLLNGQTDTIKNKYGNLICNMITKDNRLYKLIEFMIDVIIDDILNTSM